MDYEWADLDARYEADQEYGPLLDEDQPDEEEEDDYYEPESAFLDLGRL